MPSSLLKIDPTPWLMVQDGLGAVRARRFLGLHREDDENAVKSTERKFAKTQLSDGSFDGSLMKTSGVLILLADLQRFNSEGLIDNAARYLLSVIESQPGYERAKSVRPGGLHTPCDLCAFFGPYEDRSRPDFLVRGAEEMNRYREFEPLLGPKSTVRSVPRSHFDRVGPSSCYSWGLVPLSYTIEALCRVGYARDTKLEPAINALLGVQRASGGWCRNLGGHPSCSIHAIRALGSHPQLSKSIFAERALEFLHKTQLASSGRSSNPFSGVDVFAVIRAVAAWDTQLAKAIIRSSIVSIAQRQRRNGTWDGPCRVERVAAVLYAIKRLI